MPKLHFTNGFIREMTETELIGFMKRLQAANTRYWGSRENGDLVFLESPGMAYLEREMPDEPVRETKTISETPAPDAEPEEVVEEKKTVDPAVEALKEITAKSDCHKNGHKGQNQIIYKQMLSTKHGPSERYFPVCEFCGFKGRFIAKDKLSDDIKEVAKLYEG
jgi:hypothetical protein